MHLLTVKIRFRKQSQSMRSLAMKLVDLLLFPLMVILNVVFADSHVFIRRLRIFFSVAIVTRFVKVKK